ncbi:protein-glutamate O-methyltransferase [Fundidesulfovibrio butyratiphilus]
MHDRDFKRMCEFIYAECGIKLTTAKKSMLEARLQKRLRVLDLETYTQYCDLLFSPKGRELELVNLIDAVTTNTTEFFREPKHFELLQQEVLPGFMQQHGFRERLRLWSAGCSTGEEPYTLSMVLSDFRERTQGFRFSILATDISTQVIGRAMKAIYPEERVKTMSMERKKKYLLRSKSREAGLVRIVPELRNMVRFERLNFMEDFTFEKPMHIIFCRNVIIYFDRKTQENLLSRFCDNLIPGGHLFIGHSESTTGMNLPLEAVAPTVYRKI